jgi:hypothetical protein
MSQFEKTKPIFQRIDVTSAQTMVYGNSWGLRQRKNKLVPFDKLRVNSAEWILNKKTRSCLFVFIRG